MTNLNFHLKPLKTFNYLGQIGSGNCQSEIKGLAFWIDNQPFWTYQCLGCQAVSFEPGKTSVERGGFYG